MFKSYFKQDDVAPYQHYLVWIRLQHKISFVASFTISKWLKKYYTKISGAVVSNSLCGLYVH